MSRVLVRKLVGVVANSGELTLVAQARVNVREHGAVTPVPVFGTEVGGAALAQPLRSSAMGEVEFWIEADPDRAAIDLSVTSDGLTTVAGTAISAAFAPFIDPVAVLLPHPVSGDDLTITPEGEMTATNLHDALLDLYDRSADDARLRLLNRTLWALEEFIGDTGQWPTATFVAGGASQSQGLSSFFANLLELNVTNSGDAIFRYLPLITLDVPEGEFQSNLALPLGGTTNPYTVRAGIMTADANFYGAFLQFTLTGTNTWQVDAVAKTSSGTTTTPVLASTVAPNHRVNVAISGGVVTWFHNGVEVHQAAMSQAGQFLAPGVRIDKTGGTTLRALLVDYIAALYRVSR